MNPNRIGRAALFALCIGCLAFAQPQPEPRSVVDRQSSASGTFAALHVRAASATPKESGSVPIASHNSEVYEGIFIDAGKTVSLDSRLDYSSATTVAVGLMCIVCDSAATSIEASGLVLVARWAVPDAELYVTTENKATTAFLYWDSGGVIFNVYGSQFRLSLQNKGREPIAIEQITLLRRGD